MNASKLVITSLSRSVVLCFGYSVSRSPPNDRCGYVVRVLDWAGLGISIGCWFGGDEGWGERIVFGFFIRRLCRCSLVPMHFVFTPFYIRKVGR